ncbi:MAG: alpha/beta fold hydrolase [Egibacteraceae bacterium]
MTILSWHRGGVDRGVAVVLVHTWGSDGIEDWDRTGVAQTLAQAGLAVVAPDLPGHGESADVLVPPEAEPAKWTAHACLHDLDRLGVRRCTIVGYAGGGPVAGHLATSDDERVRVEQLVLVGCDDLVEEPHTAEVAAALRHPGARVWHPEAAEIIAFARRDRRHELGTLAQWLERRRWPAAPRLGALRLPVLLAVGAADPHRLRAPRLAQLFHDARLVTVPGDHRGALSSPELGRHIADFVCGGMGSAVTGLPARQRL